MGLSTRWKVLLTVALAMLCSWLFGCQSQSVPSFPLSVVNTPIPPSTEVVVNAPYLLRRYSAYNDMYFHNRLIHHPLINMLEKKNMASTFCNDDMSGCVISFNYRYVAAPRSADETLLHEMCHVKTWDTDVVYFGGHVEQADHGKVWRTCMLELDAEGAFRDIIIDNYQEKR